ncbi:hypothetical protein [Streptomyces sp. NPDC059916]|uniref:hypothetical protein n=1 Tax=Streptomyces sp. NPDC059916 TaxID=3347001 RepID=UPI00369809E2
MTTTPRAPKPKPAALTPEQQARAIDLRNKLARVRACKKQDSADIRAWIEADALRRAYKHQPEPFEAEFARLACEHPEACSCPADYPTWTPGGTT